MNESDFSGKIKEFKEIMMLNGLNTSGCSDTQIIALEYKYGKLPINYKIFLSLLGNEAGDFKKGTDLLFKDLDDINDCTLELMKEKKINPPSDLFSFLLHQGYSCFFFVTRNDNDPEVYCYTEGDKIKKTGYTFSEYILTEIELYIKHHM